MGTPRFPDIKRPASLREIVGRLLETIALEELAIANLINAEAEKIQAVLKAGISGPVSPEELREINLSVSKVLETAVAKEDRLQRKLRMILAFGAQVGRSDDKGDGDFDDDF